MTPTKLFLTTRRFPEAYLITCSPHCSVLGEHDWAWESNDGERDIRVQHAVLRASRNALRGIPDCLLSQGESWHQLYWCSRRVNNSYIYVYLHTSISSKYESPEQRDASFEVFKETLKDIDERNARPKIGSDPSVWGINGLADCTYDWCRLSHDNTPLEEYSEEDLQLLPTVATCKAKNDSNLTVSNNSTIPLCPS